MDTLILIVLGLLFLGFVIGQVTRGAQSIAGRDRCRFCGARLGKEAQGFGYADHCRKCGRAQPWAKTG